MVRFNPYRIECLYGSQTSFGQCHFNSFSFRFFETFCEHESQISFAGVQILQSLDYKSKVMGA
jgi:hypothetical protein